MKSKEPLGDSCGITLAIFLGVNFGIPAHNIVASLQTLHDKFGEVVVIVINFNYLYKTIWIVKYNGVES